MGQTANPKFPFTEVEKTVRLGQGGLFNSINRDRGSQKRKKGKEKTARGIGETMAGTAVCWLQKRPQKGCGESEGMREGIGGCRWVGKGRGCVGLHEKKGVGGSQTSGGARFVKQGEGVGSGRRRKKKGRNQIQRRGKEKGSSSKSGGETFSRVRGHDKGFSTQR